MQWIGCINDVEFGNERIVGYPSKKPIGNSSLSQYLLVGPQSLLKICDASTGAVTYLTPMPSEDAMFE